MKDAPSTVRCPKCGLDVPSDRYYKSKGRRPYGLSSTCKDCERKRLDAISRPVLTDEVQKLRWVDGNLKKKFGISFEEYQVLVQKANSVCQICKLPETQIHHATGAPQRLAVDHDAESGEIRGILCSRCNRGIGFLQHDPVILAAAIDYLQADGDEVRSANLPAGR